MNQFLINGIQYRAVYLDNPNGFGEERGGCCYLEGGGFVACCNCVYNGRCPADGMEE